MVGTRGRHTRGKGPGTSDAAPSPHFSALPLCRSAPWPPPPPSKQVLFLPPNSSACFDAFVVSGTEPSSGALLATQTLGDDLSAVYDNLTPGHTYEFTVAASSKAKGAGPPAAARAALPPATLDAKPGPPELVRAVALDDSSARVSRARHAQGGPHRMRMQQQSASAQQPATVALSGQRQPAGAAPWRPCRLWLAWGARWRRAC